MKLERFARRPVVALNPGDTLNHAMQQMWRMSIQHLPVVRHGRPVGMVSERDLLYHVCGDSYAVHELSHRHLKHMLGTSRVDDVMSTPLISLSPEDSVHDAVRLMLREGIGAVPLVTRDSIVGIVTETDILKCFLEEHSLLLCDELPKSGIVDYMSAHVFTVTPTDLKPAVIRLMRDKQVSSVPVVSDDGALLGIITEAGVLIGRKHDEGETVAGETADAHVEARDIMNESPATLTLDSRVKDAARLMVANSSDYALVAEDGKLVGILTSTDLVRAFVQANV